MTLKQSPLYRRYHYLLTRHRTASVELALLMNSRKNGIATADDKEYQRWERSRVALDSFIVATFQLTNLAGDNKWKMKKPPSKSSNKKK
jgi:hypothetical protein